MGELQPHFGRLLGAVIICLLSVSFLGRNQSETGIGIRVPSKVLSEVDKLTRDYFALIIEGFDFDRNGEKHERVERVRRIAHENGFHYAGRVGTLKDAVLLTKPKKVKKTGRADVSNTGEQDIKLLEEKLNTPGHSYSAHYMLPRTTEPRRPSYPNLCLKSPDSKNKDMYFIEHQDPPERLTHGIESVEQAIRLFSKIRNQLQINDPKFNKQWHIINTQVPGHDINIQNAWLSGYSGKGVVVSIIDDGLDFTHPDIKDAYVPEASIDITEGDFRELKPSDKLSQAHGTRCAAEIVARRNDYCGVGIAYEANISAIRLISPESSVVDMQEALALGYMNELNHIYTCSWGPSDDGTVIEGPGILARKALEEGVKNGRGGRGNIFVFAGGNGGRFDDHCNFDGYVNSIYTITISSIDMFDRHPVYSEECSANLAVTYSSNSAKGDAIFTSDIIKGCTSEHTGTSASAPIAAGIYALALQVRPELTWRDIQLLTILTAVPISLEEKGWDRNSSGMLYSNKFGYGKLDASAIVQHAKDMNLLRSHSVIKTEVDVPTGKAKRIGGPASKLQRRLLVTEGMIQSANFNSIENIGITVDIDYPTRGMLNIYLVNPRGVSSQIAASRKRDASSSGIKDWTFTTVKFWGESPLGEWKIVIIPEKLVGEYESSISSGTLNNWSLTFWGESGYGMASTFSKNTIIARNYRPYNYKINKNRKVSFRKKAILIGVVSVPLGLLAVYLYRSIKKAVKEGDNLYERHENNMNQNKPEYKDYNNMINQQISFFPVERDPHEEPYIPFGDEVADKAEQLTYSDNMNKDATVSNVNNEVANNNHWASMNLENQTWIDVREYDKKDTEPKQENS